MAASAQLLRELADRRAVLIGAAVNPDYLTEPAYTTTLAREFNMLEAEDAMKWKASGPTRILSILPLPIGSSPLLKLTP